METIGINIKKDTNKVPNIFMISFLINLGSWYIIPS